MLVEFRAVELGKLGEGAAGEFDALAAVGFGDGRQLAIEGVLFFACEILGGGCALGAGADDVLGEFVRPCVEGGVGGAERKRDEQKNAEKMREFHWGKTNREEVGKVVMGRGDFGICGELGV